MHPNTNSRVFDSFFFFFLLFYANSSVYACNRVYIKYTCICNFNSLTELTHFMNKKVQKYVFKLNLLTILCEDLKCIIEQH